MSTWERLAGDTDEFAVRFSLERDPDKDVFDDPAYGGSWGSFEIWVQGVSLCAHTAPGGASSAVSWYLLPLIEWLGRNWDALLHEERLPLANQTPSAAETMTAEPPLQLGATPDRYYGDLERWQEWWRRHALEAAADGGLFPRVYLRRWGDKIEISWSSIGLVGAPDGFHFAAPVGVARYPAGGVAETLHQVALEAAQELCRRHPDSLRASRAKAALDAARDKQRTAERLAWLTGHSNRLRDAWESAQEALNTAGQARTMLLDPTPSPLVIKESPQLAVLFGSVKPTISREEAIELANLMLEAIQRPDEARSESLDLDELLAEVEAGSLPDYAQGNQLANSVIGYFELHDERPIDVVALLERLGVRRRDVRLKDHTIRGLSLAGPGHQPSCLVNQAFWRGKEEHVRRFTLAHELCHLLFDRKRAVRLAVASGPWAPKDIERRANAFAAALLLPRPLLDRAAASTTAEYGTVQWIKEIAKAADVGALATLDRLANLGLLDEAERERLRPQLETRSGSDAPFQD